jgi:hypothetical protein
MTEVWQILSVRVSPAMHEQISDYAQRTGAVGPGEALRSLLALGLDQVTEGSIAIERTARENARAVAMVRMRECIDAAFSSARDLYDSKLRLHNE